MVVFFICFKRSSAPQASARDYFKFDKISPLSIWGETFGEAAEICCCMALRILSMIFLHFSAFSPVYFLVNSAHPIPSGSCRDLSGGKKVSIGKGRLGEAFGVIPALATS